MSVFSSSLVIENKIRQLKMNNKEIEARMAILADRRNLIPYDDITTHRAINREINALNRAILTNAVLIGNYSRQLMNPSRLYTKFPKGLNDNN